MKKAFVLILFAVITLSACNPNDIPDTEFQLENAPEAAVDWRYLPDEHPDKSKTESVLLMSDDTHQNEIPEPEPASTDSLSITSVSDPNSPEVVIPEDPSLETVSTQPEPTTPESEVTVPVETEPVATKSAETEPEVTQPPVPEASEPVHPEPVSTEPEVAQLDIAALESYGRSYASSAYGYNGTSVCGPSSGAGYFPGATKEILTMEDGYNLVRQAIDSQYRRDMAYGYSPFEEINGVIVRCPINIHIEATGQSNVYVIWVYYGGSA